MRPIIYGNNLLRNEKQERHKKWQNDMRAKITYFEALILTMLDSKLHWIRTRVLDLNDFSIS